MGAGEGVCCGVLGTGGIGSDGGSGGVGWGSELEGASFEVRVRLLTDSGVRTCRSLYCPIKASVTSTDARTIDIEIARERFGGDDNKGAGWVVSVILTLVP